MTTAAPPSPNATTVLGVRFTAKERKLAVRAAKKAGVTPNAYARAATLEKATLDINGIRTQEA